MTQSDQSSHRQPLHGQRAWYRLALGRLVLEAERVCLDAILPDLFGYHLLQVGRVVETDLLSASRISHRLVLDQETATPLTPMPGLYGHPAALPIASDSIDVLLLPHTLDLGCEPHQVLREAERVLIAEGSLVIVGFNPWSLWGMWRLFLRRRGSMPWRGRFVSLPRLRDWLALLGFDEVQIKPYFFRPPLQHTGIMRKLTFMETLGTRYCPQLAGGYVLVARKRVSTLTRIKPRWRAQPRLLAVSAAKQPTA